MFTNNDFTPRPADAGAVQSKPQPQPQPQAGSTQPHTPVPPMGYGPDPFALPGEAAIMPTQSGAPTSGPLMVQEAQDESLVYASPDILEAIENAEVGTSLSQAYYEFNTPGETLRALYCGKSTITKRSNGEMNTLPAVVFQTRSGVFKNSSADLVEKLSPLTPGTPVQIRYTGETTTGRGNQFKVFEVNLLSVSNPNPRGNSQEEITAFWMEIKTRGFSSEDAQRILSEQGRDFAKARAALMGSF